MTGPGNKAPLPPPLPTPDSLLKVAIEAAKISGRIQVRSLKRTLKIQIKGESTNLVTDVDLRCEKRILAHLKKHFPDHEYVAEEGGKSRQTSPFRWLIDPLDGTTNYAHGYPAFCTSIALEKNGVIEVGVVYDPVRKELFTARKGKGAYLNGEPITPSGIEDLEQALLVTGFPYDIQRSEKNVDQFHRFLLRAQAVRRDGSAALDLCYTAMGRFDGYWEFSLAPWDLAAGSLILTEAGGKVTSPTGRTLSIYRGDILASNGPLHAAMLRVLRRRKGRRHRQN